MKKVLTGSTLKILAVISMVIDHFAQVVLKNGIILNAPYSRFSDAQFSLLMNITNICHIAGRIAFPIFCFLLVEGFLHTHDLKKYLLNLGIFAVVSEPVYDLALKGTLISPDGQNVMFTLLLGLIVLTVIKKACGNIWLGMIVTAAGAFISYICRLDGWYYGILLMAVFYFFHDKPVLRNVFAILIMYICGLDFSIRGLISPYFITAACSLIFISLYNGKRGMRMKYFFYVFYPAHFIVFYVLSAYIIVPRL
ncbi:conjugal transfer protein TraX [Blautia schinkii]|nr:conjugal transfer protein TraX [Blautia schinkii]